MASLRDFTAGSIEKLRIYYDETTDPEHKAELANIIDTLSLLHARVTNLETESDINSTDQDLSGEPQSMARRVFEHPVTQYAFGIGTLIAVNVAIDMASTAVKNKIQS